LVTSMMDECLVRLGVLRTFPEGDYGSEAL